MKTKTCISAIVLLILYLTSCSSRPLPYTFLIPASYEGVLRVVCNEECGVKPRVENGRQILEFNEKGIVILNSEFFTGDMSEKDMELNDGETKSFLADMKSEYYLVDDKGNKTKITQIANAGEQTAKAPSILPGEITVSGFSYHNSEVDVKGIVYRDFYLYNSNTTTTKEAMSLQKIEAATKELINACRTSQ